MAQTLQQDSLERAFKSRYDLDYARLELPPQRAEGTPEHTASPEEAEKHRGARVILYYAALCVGTAGFGAFCTLLPFDSHPSGGVVSVVTACLWLVLLAVFLTAGIYEYYCGTSDDVIAARAHWHRWYDQVIQGRIQEVQAGDNHDLVTLTGYNRIAMITTEQIPVDLAQCPSVRAGDYIRACELVRISSDEDAQPASLLSTLWLLLVAATIASVLVLTLS